MVQPPRVQKPRYLRNRNLARQFCDPYQSRQERIEEELTELKTQLDYHESSLDYHESSLDYHESSLDYLESLHFLFYPKLAMPPKLIGMDRLKEFDVKAVNMGRELERGFSKHKNFFELNEVGQPDAAGVVDPTPVS